MRHVKIVHWTFAPPTREKVSIPTLDKRSARPSGRQRKIEWKCDPPFPPSSADRPAGRHRLRGRRRGPARGRPVLGVHFGIPTASAQEESRADTYRLLTLFGDVFERVRAEYVDPVNDKDLVENAINGMLTGLDPHSSLHERQGVPRHAGADQGRVRRPRHRGHPGERLHQGDLADRRHPGRQGRHQGRRHHHRDRRQDRRRASA